LDFNGKNWIPFEKDDQLYFIYSLEPLVILQLYFDQQDTPALKQIFCSKEFKPRWEIDFANSIGQVRGGTPGIRFEQNIIGFTHEVHHVPNYQFHTLGLFILNLSDFKLRLHPLSDLAPGFLIDPYGAVFSKGRMQLFCSVVEGDLHRSDSDVANVVFSFQTKTLRDWLHRSEIKH
jgi:hypothetical protein